MKIVAVFVCLLFATVALTSDLDTARALINDSRYDEARVILEKSVNDPAQKAESLVLLTSLYNEKGDYERSVNFGKQAIQLLPKSSEAHYNYAVALRIKMTNVSKLKAMMSIGSYKDELAKAIGLDPKNTNAREEEIGFLLSVPSIVGGDIQAAKKRIEELKAYDEDAARDFTVAVLRREGNLEGAIKMVKEYLDKAPDGHRSRLSLAMLLQEAKRFTEAEQELTRLVAVTEGTWALAATYQLGRTRILGQYDQQKAVESMLEYIAKAPDQGQDLPTKTAAYWRVGNAYEQLKQLDKARQAYHKAIELDPKNEEAKKALKALPKE